MRTLLLGSVCSLIWAQTPPLTYDQLLQRAKPSPAQLELDTLLAEHRRDLSGTAGFLREGPTVGASAGPRRTDAGRSSDQGVEVDLPLFLDRSARRAFSGALGSAEPLLRAAVGVDARLALRRAYLDAWLEQQAHALQEEDVATVRGWLKAAQARLEAGADPAYQVSLVEGELMRAQLALAETQAREAAAWGALRLLADLPATPAPLSTPDSAELPAPEGLEARFRAGTLARALPGRLELEQRALAHRAAADQSRWSLRGGFAKEGDEARIAKLGLAYRFRRPGEAQAAARSLEAARAQVRRTLEQAEGELEARFRTALVQQEASRAIPAMGDPKGALDAITLRLEAGRERPSEALPIRRQLLEVRQADLRRRHAQALLAAELEALTASQDKREGEPSLRSASLLFLPHAVSGQRPITVSESGMAR